MSNNMEGWKADLSHHLHLVLGSSSFTVNTEALGRSLRLVAIPTTTKICCHEGVLICKRWCDLVPLNMALRIIM